jgi:hypothetical protein
MNGCVDPIGDRARDQAGSTYELNTTDSIGYTTVRVSDLRTEDDQDAKHDHGDQDQQQSVLYQTLPPFFLRKHDTTSFGS